MYKIHCQTDLVARLMYSIGLIVDRTNRIAFHLFARLISVQQIARCPLNVSVLLCDPFAQGEDETIVKIVIGDASMLAVLVQNR